MDNLLQQAIDTGIVLQRIAYPCGCELLGKSPMPVECPTHGPVQTKPKEILVSIVLDESGSMNSCRDQTISGYNEYLNGLRQDGTSYLITLSKFALLSPDPTCRVIYKNKPLAEAPELNRNTYQPCGNTPLYDAVGATIHALEPEVAGRAVLMIIITDGEENASREYTLDQVNAMRAEKEKQGWTFVYLGANQDAWKVGQTMGMHHANTYSYRTANIQPVMANLARNSAMYARSAYTVSGVPVASMDFFSPGDDLSVNQNARNLGKLGGKKRMTTLTAEQRKGIAKKGAAKRWPTGPKKAAPAIYPKPPVNT